VEGEGCEVLNVFNWSKVFHVLMFQGFIILCKGFRVSMVSGFKGLGFRISRYHVILLWKQWPSRLRKVLSATVYIIQSCS
jgi:hypothetical protein